MFLKLLKRVSLVTVTLCCYFLEVQAAERYEGYNGIRSLGMGGVGVAVVNDETALLVNPAALGKLRDYFITVIDPELEVGAATQSVNENSWLAFMDPQLTLDKVSANPGKRLHQSVKLFPSFVVPNFGIGLYGGYRTDAMVDQAQTAYTLRYRNDFAAVFGFNFRLFDGRFKFGVNAKAINRVEIDRDDINPSSTGLTLNGLAKEGFGFGSDVGIILTAPWKLLPTLALVYRDAGNTRFNVNEGMFLSTSERPDTEAASLDVGLSIFPIMGKRTRSTFALEYKDALTFSEETDHNRRLHYGIEFNFSDALFVRAGMNQNYWTAGLELAMFNYQIQLATYGEEVGTASAKEEERRYAFKFAYRF